MRLINIKCSASIARALNLDVIVSKGDATRVFIVARTQNALPWLLVTLSLDWLSSGHC